MNFDHKIFGVLVLGFVLAMSEARVAVADDGLGDVVLSGSNLRPSGAPAPKDKQPSNNDGNAPSQPQAKQPVGQPVAEIPAVAAPSPAKPVPAAPAQKPAAAKGTVINWGNVEITGDREPSPPPNNDLPDLGAEVPQDKYAPTMTGTEIKYQSKNRKANSTFKEANEALLARAKLGHPAKVVGALPKVQNEVQALYACNLQLNGKQPGDLALAKRTQGKETHYYSLNAFGRTYDHNCGESPAAARRRLTFDPFMTPKIDPVELGEAQEKLKKGQKPQECLASGPVGENLALEVFHQDLDYSLGSADPKTMFKEIMANRRLNAKQRELAIAKEKTFWNTRKQGLEACKDLFIQFPLGGNKQYVGPILQSIAKIEHEQSHNDPSLPDGQNGPASGGAGAANPNQGASGPKRTQGR